MTKTSPILLALAKAIHPTVNYWNCCRPASPQFPLVYSHNEGGETPYIAVGLQLVYHDRCLLQFPPTIPRLGVNLELLAYS